MSRHLARLVQKAHHAFEQAPMDDEIEPGFTLGLDDAVVHLRKACRAILVGDVCLSPRLDDLRPFTVALECGFFAMERTLHAALVANNSDSGAHAFDHEAIFTDSHRLGLWDAAEAQALADLYRERRSAAYYRDNAATHHRARAVIRVATELHRVIVASQSRWAAECVCLPHPHNA